MTAQNLHLIERSLDVIARTLARLFLIQTDAKTTKVQVTELQSLGFGSAQIAEMLGIGQNVVNQHAYLARKGGKQRTGKARAKRAR